jgi:7-keto-8-aminopelargonate synthetase-like enzyme
LRRARTIAAIQQHGAGSLRQTRLRDLDGSVTERFRTTLSLVVNDEKVVIIAEGEGEEASLAVALAELRKRRVSLGLPPMVPARRRRLRSRGGP